MKPNQRVRDARMLRRAVKGRWAETAEQRQKTVDLLGDILNDPAASDMARLIAAEAAIEMGRQDQELIHEALDQIANQEPEEPEP